MSFLGKTLIDTFTTPNMGLNPGLPEDNNSPTTCNFNLQQLQYIEQNTAGAGGPAARHHTSITGNINADRKPGICLMFVCQSTLPIQLVMVLPAYIPAPDTAYKYIDASP